MQYKFYLKRHNFHPVQNLFKISLHKLILSSINDEADYILKYKNQGKYY